MFQLTRGIRQGGVLPPYLFAVYVDDILAIVEKRRSGCFYQSVCVSIVMYADDILLLSPSVTVVQELLYVCENVLGSLDLSINPKKSVCTRIGPRCNTICCDIVSSKGHALPWVDSVNLGVYLVRSRMFKCDFDNAKSSFYRALIRYMGKLADMARKKWSYSLCIPNASLVFFMQSRPVQWIKLRKNHWNLQ